MKRSSPMSLFYPECSHILMTQCDVRSSENSLGLLIHVPDSAMLIERHSSLKTVRILDPDVIISLAKQWEGGPSATVTVELMLAERKFRYSVKELRMADSTIWLDVSPEMTTGPAADSEGVALASAEVG